MYTVKVCIRFQENEYDTFWIFVKSEFVKIIKTSRIDFTSFAPTYLYETAFSTLSIIINKYWYNLIS